ncbi:MAG: D-glycero-beta-D-manno-heptose-7-phosphate kinase, partial [Selenomonas sp.]|nr:D-glycero-beta-D-manno-heptose-7-phosphate kinase [Selenomonas sp.]
MDKQKMYDFVAQATGKCRLLVVGDVMLDKYYYGEVTRISPEAPVPVTRVLSQKETLGGAANVAHNLALLGCQTQIAGYVGDDYHCQSLTDKFTARGI